MFFERRNIRRADDDGEMLGAGIPSYLFQDCPTVGLTAEENVKDDEVCLLFSNSVECRTPIRMGEYLIAFAREKITHQIEVHGVVINHGDPRGRRGGDWVAHDSTKLAKRSFKAPRRIVLFRGERQCATTPAEITANCQRGTVIMRGQHGRIKHQRNGRYCFRAGSD